MQVSFRTGRQDRAAWSDYHLIGDALRSDDLAVSPATSSAFMAVFSHVSKRAARVRAGRDAGCAPFAGVAPPRHAGIRGRRGGCHADVDRRAATAGRADSVRAGRRSRAESHGDSMQRVAMASVPAAGGPAGREANIIRDASLDQYLEAHQQFAQQPVMPGSMPLIRAAAVSTQGQ